MYVSWRSVMLRKLILLTLIFNVFVYNIHAKSQEPIRIIPSLPKMYLTGTAKYEYYFWDLYNANLYTTGKSFHNNKPFIIKLSYLRDISSDDLVSTTIDLMRQQDNSLTASTINKWVIFLRRAFPDVNEGDIIYGYYDGHNKTIFFNKTHQKLGSMSNARFSKLFFNIWLGIKTTFPKNAKKLKGIN
jgi:hypothetical protein